ncbi:protein PHYLLO, chloroplastic-like [Prosopis cineraria]|uniref:protein PHYLLO, chloroplastic-like n=1 Tax=Prosopis cineraria TaxID=364024 RepID=UPI00240F8A2C|nr:protein PHYLLO, chloroplastic-like [Prosopis cineraria]
MLSGLSIGRQPSLWEDLKDCRTPLLFMYGEKDTKFKQIAETMINTVSSGCESGRKIATMFIKWLRSPTVGMLSIWRTLFQSYMP